MNRSGTRNVRTLLPLVAAAVAAAIASSAVTAAPAAASARAKKPAASAAAATRHAGTRTAAARPAAAPASRAMAREYTDRRDFERALPIFDRLVAENPQDVDLLIEAARVAGFADRNARAADLYEQAMRVEPMRRMDILPSLAWQSLWAGRNVEAARYFDELQWRHYEPERTRQGMREARLAIARSHVEAKRYDEAIVAYEFLVYQNLQDSDLAIERARVLGFADRNAEAAAEYERIARDFPARAPDVSLAQGWQTLWAGRAADAIAPFDLAATKPEFALDALRGKALACAELGRNDCARDAWAAVLAREPADVAARIGEGRALLWLGRPQEAMERFDTVLVREPGNRQARVGRAYALNAAGYPLEAAREFRRVGALESEDERLQAARAFYWSGLPEQALPILEPASSPASRWLRDYRVAREAQNEANGSADFATDSDKLDSRIVVAAAGLRTPINGSAWMTLRYVGLEGPDTTVDSLYRDLMRPQGDGVLQVMGGNAASLATPASLADAQLVATARDLTGSLASKLATLTRDQRLAALPLGDVGAALQTAGAVQLRNLATTGDAALLRAFLASQAGAQSLQQLSGAIGRAAAYDPRTRRRDTGREAMLSWRMRLGDGTSGAGVVWPQLSIGARDYGNGSSLAWRARAKWIPKDRWTIDADAGNGVIETIAAVRNEVKYDTQSISAEFRANDRWTFSGGLGHLRFDDGNDRTRLMWRGEYRIGDDRPWRFGIEGLEFSDSKPWDATRTNLGYWNPDRYSEQRAYVAADGSRAGWDWSGKLGIGHFAERDGFGSRNSGVTTTWELSLNRDLSPGVQVRFYLGGSRSGAGLGSGGSGYHRTFAGISINGWFGGR